ncbi:PepSY-like domain-containing protein [Empedobacter sp.]|uniref:PepSY-like domain-containing protein n=1 Tax=Empedobacter sp. TaxID=1927715 RepID=UPI0028A895B0|nr:PepSY-like domain-containing protein [Empedobacter sp.]
MRKIVLSTAAILSLVLSSCESKKSENTQVETSKTEVAEQPIVSESDIANNPESSTSPNTYVVLQDNGQQKTVNIDPNETIISANNLPVNAQNFVSQNFGNMEFVNAIKEVKHNITTYNIQLKDGTKIEFTDNGDWTEVKNGLGKSIPTKFFPDNIQKYLQSKYPKIDAKSIEMDTKDKEIKVELLQNNVDLKFDLNGNFIKID